MEKKDKAPKKKAKISTKKKVKPKEKKAPKSAVTEKSKLTGIERRKANLRKGGFEKDHDLAVHCGEISKPYTSYKATILKKMGVDPNSEKHKQIAAMKKKDFDSVIGELLYMDKKELKKLSKKSDIPMIVSIYARSMVKDSAKGENKNVKDIVDRLYGKAEQKIDAEISGPDNGPITGISFKIIDSNDKSVESVGSVGNVGS